MNFIKKLAIISLFLTYPFQANAQSNQTTPQNISQEIAKIDTLNSVEVTKLMGVGWNLGNTLEAVGGETAWGNPLTNRALIKSVKAAGFKSIRIPVAWSQFSDSNKFIIDEKWLNRVEEVVNYALEEDLIIVLNMHWDGGWMQPTYAKQEYANNRMKIMWTQIANRFEKYDGRLMFAGTNEVMVDGDYGTPKKEYYTVQNGFNQVFIDTVRATGGKNANRFLIVQGFNTNIDHTISFAKLPNDSAKSKMLMEVHYYDPYNFTLNKDSNTTQWGKIAKDPTKVETWANEEFVDKQFLRMKTNYIDKGIGVILGEFGAQTRFSVKGHEVYRTYWNYYISYSAQKHGLVPMYWDNGYTGDNAMGLFNRKTGEQAYPELIKLITKPAN